MKYLPASVAIAPFLLCSLLGQTPIEPVLVASSTSQVRRDIPPELSAGNARRLVRFDPDGDLLHDLAILWSSGEVTYGNAPEVMTAFVRCPLPLAKDIERVPAAHAMTGTTGHDGLLVATGASLVYLTYDPELARVSPATDGFTVSPVVADGGWQVAVGLVTRVIGGTCWIAALDDERHDVLVGRWTPNGIVDTVAFTASSVVQEMVFLNLDNTPTPQIALRTQAALEFWETTGVPVCPPVAAPVPLSVGAIAVVRDGGQEHIAWLSYSGTQWLLRLQHGANELDAPEPVSVEGYVPTRFRPIGLHSIPGNGGPDVLVLSQNTTPWQIMMTKAPGGVYKPHLVFEAPGISYPADTCAPLLHDMNNDEQPDYTIVLDSQHCVQIDLNLPTPPLGGVQILALAGGPPDLLPVECRMSQSNGGPEDDTIDLRVEVPSAHMSRPLLEAQVVAWPHRITDPTSTSLNNPPVGAAQANLMFDLSPQGTLLDRPLLKVTLMPVDAPWEANDHYYLMLRFVERSQGAIVWSSPATMVAFVAHDGTGVVNPEMLNYVHEIIVPQNPPTVPVRGNNRNVGVILKALRVNPPNSTIKVPNSGPTTPGPTPTPW